VTTAPGRPARLSRYTFEVCHRAPARVRTRGRYEPDASQRAWTRLERADTVLVPGAGRSRRDPRARRGLVEAVIQAHRRGGAGSCIWLGAFVLAAAGLLDGRRARRHTGPSRRVGRPVPAGPGGRPQGVLYVDQGDVAQGAPTPPGSAAAWTSACTVKQPNQARAYADADRRQDGVDGSRTAGMPVAVRRTAHPGPRSRLALPRCWSGGRAARTSAGQRRRSDGARSRSRPAR